MKHVLLTGAGGFVGSHVLEHILMTTDWVVTAINSPHLRLNVPSRVAQVLASRSEQSVRVHVINHNLTEPLRRTSFGAAPINYIFNVASESSVDYSIRNPGQFARDNVAMMVTVLDLACRIEPEVLLHLSSNDVYGAEPLGRPSKEWDPILPSTPYSASKAAQEAIAIGYWRTYGVPLVIVNAMHIFGERQRPEQFIPKALKRIIAGEFVPIYVTNGVPGRRAYLHARNLADAMCFLAKRGTKAYGLNDFPVPDRFNVAGEEEIDNHALALQIADAARNYSGRDFALGTVEYIESSTLRSGYDPHYSLDVSKIARAGWTPPMPMRESLERTVRWTLEHPEWLAMEVAR